MCDVGVLVLILAGAGIAAQAGHLVGLIAGPRRLHLHGARRRAYVFGTLARIKRAGQAKRRK